MSKTQLSDLAVNGGPKIKEDAWPGRGLIGREEKAAVDALFDQSIAAGEAFGYGGPAEDAYCRDFAEFMGGGFADAVNAGTTAIYVALRALDLEPFTEVIVGAVTDPGGMMPIPLLNCIPMVADTMPGSYNTGPEQIEALITPLSRAIVVAHIAGEPADMIGIMEVAKKHGLPVIEDCAQSHGARLNGRYVGTFGDAAAFSTMFGKHHCTGGQGGVVYTQKEDLYKRIRHASDRGKPFGLPAGSTNCIASLNLNLNDLSATIGSVQLKKLPGIVQRRQEFVAKLKESIKGIASVTIPEPLPGAEHAYWFLKMCVHTEVITCDKVTFCGAIGAEGLPIGESYRAALPHLMDWYKNRRVFGTSGLPWSSDQYRGDANRSFPCPNALATMDTHFNLYVSESWGDKEVEDVTAILKKVDSAYRKE